jgi:hypothetical protein
VPAKQRQRKIILMCLQFFHKYGHAYVDLIEHDQEENKKAWKTLREEIRELYQELSEKFKQ